MASMVSIDNGTFWLGFGLSCVSGLGFIGGMYLYNLTHTEERTPIKIKKEKVQDAYGRVYAETRIVPTNEYLIKILREIHNCTSLYAIEPYLVASTDLFHKWNKILSSNASERPLTKIYVDYLQKLYPDYIRSIESMVSQNVIDFSSLFYLYKEGQIVIVKQHGKTVAGKVVSFEYKRDTTKYFEISIAVNMPINGKCIRPVHKNVSIYEFKGVKKIDGLEVQNMNTSDEITHTLLHQRGSRYVKYAIGCHYVQYDGLANYKSNKFGIKGRIIIDGKSFAVYNGNYPNYVDMYDDYDHSDKNKFTDEQLICMWPFLPAYELDDNHRWMEVCIDDIKDIKFNDNLFDDLELPEIKKGGLLVDRKHIIHDVIKNYGDSSQNFKDIVRNKGGGLVFLLSGPPGVGKTLTAEATAEILHKPLYYVSCSELGVSIEDIEKRLKTILELIKMWGAVALIDEADVFIETRQSSDISRNAIVGTFLKILEYHNGILFLTTNRVKQIDSAILSRVNISLNYEELTTESKSKIWKNFLSKIGITLKQSQDLDDLSQYNLNGRQIKNIVRLMNNSKQKDWTSDQIQSLIISVT